MLLLALDTSTPAVTVALHDGENGLAESTAIDARRHTTPAGARSTGPDTTPTAVEPTAPL